MEKNELIRLETVVGSTRNANGFREKEETAQTEVFCAVKSVTGQEFYDAQRSGTRADIIFVVDRDDLEMASRIVGGKKIQPSRVIHDGTTYSIIRGYAHEKRPYDLELTCEEVE
ncbi:MAG: phage head closure protein [Lachnospiraceae bacterium]|nr:phage head closure protein [Lachnospiraceae bacterium]MCM1239960.1 phage head closure protein [Lachnospiraceae bacterium]